MMKAIVVMIVMGCLTLSAAGQSKREVRTLKEWKFWRGEAKGAEEEAYDDREWEDVVAPHDWAIKGPFGADEDLQRVAVEQNMESAPTTKTGRTGGLPHAGIGWYRTFFDTPAGARAELVFDGAMSEARVYVNGRELCWWPYGYNAFHADATGLLHADGKRNLIAVRLENKPRASRWYPGAGLYREVKLVVTGDTRVPTRGVVVTTPVASEALAEVVVKTSIEGAASSVITSIYDDTGAIAAADTLPLAEGTRHEALQFFKISAPRLWSPEGPNLYEARSRIYREGRVVDEYTTRFGIREARIDSSGFTLNGQRRKFRGVCNHHDLGPLGAAVNRAALRHRLSLLKDMGCDAIRTAHNMPSEALVTLCDEMGFMLIVEAFDEWDVGKCENGYHRFFKDWAERDLVNMVRHFRSNPSVILWSIGNEVPSQARPGGAETARRLQEICHREDPTRLVTCGVDQVDRAIASGFVAALDVVGLNYRTHRYEAARAAASRKVVLGSETASTVSSRGVYKFPVEKRAQAMYADHQSSSYDVECCRWSNLPDVDFALADDFAWTLGQFVWTGFDYLGEPTPYDADAWPSHSSLFGVIDLACLPKDRYWLYRARWNEKSPTLHLLPHWTWPGREGEVTPVFAYSSYPEVELFANGKSQGRRKLGEGSGDDRYRARWMDVVYEPGELRAVAYDEAGNAREERVVRTAGAPRRVELVAASSDTLRADGDDLVYVTARVVDKDGNLCPFDGRLATFSVAGGGIFKAAANGDPTCLDLFQEPRMHFFSGQLTVIVQSNGSARDVHLTATAKGLAKGKITIHCR
jgi:beta-galactosidase